MSSIYIAQKKFTELFSSQQIQDKVDELSDQLSRDYAGIIPLFLVILNGSFMFASDLFKRLRIQAEISFIKVASYSGMTSTGKITTAIGLIEQITDRDIIIIDDILETGNTLYHFIQHTIIPRKPRSYRTVVLLEKPVNRRFGVKADYVGFSIPEEFVVGYGLDCDGVGRNFPCIYRLDREHA